MSDPAWLYAAGVIFASGVIQGATGFGFAVFAVPLLLFTQGAHDTVIVATVLGIVACIWVAVVRRHHLDWSLLKAWTTGTVIGLPPGLALFGVLPQHVLTTIAGIGLATLAVMIIAAPRRPVAEPGWLRIVAGVPAGVLAATVAMPGPPVALYSAWVRCPKSTFQATSAGFGGLASLLALCGYAVTGNIHGGHLHVALTLVPPLAAGVALGLTLHGRISQKWFEQITLLLIVVLAVSLLTRL